MVRVFHSRSHEHTIHNLEMAVEELNRDVDSYMSSQPGLLVSGLGELYFHYTPDGRFTMFLPVMFATMVEDDE
jgi:hypothetical protein